MKEEKSGGKKLKYETFIELSAQSRLNLISNYFSLKQIGLLTNSGSLSYEEFTSMLSQQEELALDTSKNKGTEDKVGIFLITGSPGAGKSDLGYPFAKLPLSSNWTAIDAPYPEYPNLYDTVGLKTVILKKLEENPKVKNLVIILRGYHLIYPYVEFIDKDPEITAIAINRGVIAKVNANNIYRNKYKELLPCLTENCSKGICDAIVLERSNASENRVEKVLSILESLNDRDNIVTMKLPRLFQTSFDSLKGILARGSKGIYRKYSYTFHNYFSSKYYTQKIMKKTTLNCAIPVQVKLFRDSLDKVIGEFIKDWNIALKQKENIKPELAKSYIDAGDERMIIGKI